MNENPVSPKVWAVVAALASPGVLLLLVGALIGNDTLLTIGAALLGASPIAGGVGYAKNDPDRVVKKKRSVGRKPREAGYIDVITVGAVCGIVALALLLIILF